MSRFSHPGSVPWTKCMPGHGGGTTRIVTNYGENKTSLAERLKDKIDDTSKDAKTVDTTEASKSVEM